MNDGVMEASCRLFPSNLKFSEPLLGDEDDHPVEDVRLKMREMLGTAAVSGQLHTVLSASQPASPQQSKDFLQGRFPFPMSPTSTAAPTSPWAASPDSPRTWRSEAFAQAVNTPPRLGDNHSSRPGGSSGMRSIVPALPEPVARGGEMSPRGRSPRGASPVRQVVAQEELDDVSTEVVRLIQAVREETLQRGSNEEAQVWKSQWMDSQRAQSMATASEEQARRELQNTRWQCGEGSVALRQAAGRSSSLEVRLASLEEAKCKVDKQAAFLARRVAELEATLAATSSRQMEDQLKEQLKTRSRLGGMLDEADKRSDALESRSAGLERALAAANTREEGLLVEVNRLRGQNEHLERSRANALAAASAREEGLFLEVARLRGKNEHLEEGARKLRSNLQLACTAKPTSPCPPSSPSRGQRPATASARFTTEPLGPLGRLPRTPQPNPRTPDRTVAFDRYSAQGRAGVG